jgi:ABC-type nickel/cobalt efflux system permease component RcnA
MSRRALLVAAITAPLLALMLVGLSRPEPTAAHPLGNFTVNRYSRLELYSDAVRVRYVLDMAEIPAFQEMGEIDSNGDGETNPAESEAYLGRKAAAIKDDLHLSVDGSTAALELLSSEITYPEGQAGLRTLRIGLLLQSTTTATSVSMEYRDENYADRVGWKEIVARPAQGVNVSSSSVASDDVSSELTSYPSDLLSSPLDVTAAVVSYEPGGGITAPVIESETGIASQVQIAPKRAGAGFASLINTEDLTLPVIVLSLLLALGFGAIHALEPGHGKTFVAAYFVGVKGTVRQALGLGAIVAVTHTIGVLLIGMIVLFGSQYILPERLYPWLSLASGVMVLGLGVRLLAARAGGWRAIRRFASVLNPNVEHDHKHGHQHPHGHTHEPTPEAPPWKTLLALGLADGLTPSPSALVVLLAAVSLDRIGLGLLLIVAFSVGLAAVLTLVSLALLYSRRVFEWLGRRRQPASGNASEGWLGAGTSAVTSVVLRVAPLGGAVALLAIGLVLTVRALMQPGLPIL